MCDDCTPSAKEAPACSASCAKLEARRALRPTPAGLGAVGTAPIGVCTRLRRDTPGEAAPLGPAVDKEVVGMSTFRLGFPCITEYELNSRVVVKLGLPWRW